MNNLTTSPVTQKYYEHAEACKDKAFINFGKGRYTENHSEEHDRFRCLNHRYEVDRLTLDLNSDASITGKLDRTVQIGHGKRTCIARMNAIYSEHVCYI